MTDPDAIVVGGGPNGLSAAVELARNGLGVLLLEANDTIGGAARTEALTLTGFRHDVGSAVYPLGIGSPFFSELSLADRGLRWVHPTIPLAHPLDHGRAALLRRDVEETARRLGDDHEAYEELVHPFVRHWPTFADHVLDAPLRLPRAPALMARFGARALRLGLSPSSLLRTDGGQALLAGNAAHSGIPLGRPLAGAVGLTLMVAAHAVGWPFARGGSGAITDALASLLTTLGGRIETGTRVRSLSDLPPARATLLALTHRQVARVAGDRLPSGYRRRLERWRYGPGAFKVDWALDGPIPWTNAEAGQAGTVHVGGTLEEIARAERTVWQGGVSDRPFVLLAQPSLFDDTRAPQGKHVAWGYCHVPAGWEGDVTDRIEAQIERFAPGFRERVLARSVLRPSQLEAWNSNLVGGDVNGGSLTLSQMLGPPRWFARHPWGTPVDGLYVCSASRPPGGGVHGMAGYRAAREALHRTFGIR